MRKTQWSVVGGLVVGLMVAGGAPLHAQHPVEGTELMIANLRTHGQPVIPVFDGWYQKPDGTYDLCFGYFNLNTEQAVEIPIGPDNFVEPAQYHGRQPTRFDPVPQPPNDHRRYFCTLVVNVPEDFGTQRVVWTLRQGGKEFSVPGHITAPNYTLEEIYQYSRQVEAPVLRWEPSGPEGRGRSGVQGPTMHARVGSPLSIPISVTHPKGEAEEWTVQWFKHQGPGDVTFSPQTVTVKPGEKAGNTSATFSAPGTYLLRVEAIDDARENGSYQFHCCWTTGYVEVTVTQ